MIKHKLTIPHNPDCYAIKNVKRGAWDNPWAFITAEYRLRDKNGNRHKNGGKRWYVVRCNCTGCPGEVMIEENSLMNAIPMGCLSPKKRRRGTNEQEGR